MDKFYIHRGEIQFCTQTLFSVLEPRAFGLNYPVDCILEIPMVHLASPNVKRCMVQITMQLALRSLRPFQMGIPGDPPVVIDFHGSSWRFPWIPPPECRRERGVDFFAHVMPACFQIPRTEEVKGGMTQLPSLAEDLSVPNLHIS